jgi:hypothetical protein
LLHVRHVLTSLPILAKQFYSISILQRRTLRPHEVTPLLSAELGTPPRQSGTSILTYKLKFICCPFGSQVQVKQWALNGELAGLGRPGRWIVFDSCSSQLSGRTHVLSSARKHQLGLCTPLLLSTVLLPPHSLTELLGPVWQPVPAQAGPRASGSPNQPGGQEL